MLSKLISGFLLVLGTPLLISGVVLVMGYGIPEGDLCSAAVLEENYASFSVEQREAVCVEEAMQGMVLLSIYTFAALIIGGLLVVLGGIWAWIIWSKKA